jgi:hypothetical protein
MWASGSSLQNEAELVGALESEYLEPIQHLL